MNSQWTFPCPECGYADYNQSGFIIAPLWNEKGSKCPKCQTECRIRKVGTSSATEHAEIEAV